VGNVGSSKAQGWTRQAVAGGIVAGVGGAVVLAFIRLIVVIQLFWAVSYIVGSTSAYPAMVARSGIWTALKLPAYPFVGQRALDPGFDPGVVLLGVVNHLVVSVCWGVLFGIVAQGLSRKATIVLGVLWGILVGWVSYYLLLPLTGRAPLPEGPRLAIVLMVYVPYGLAMAIIFLRWQRAARRRQGITAS
jgi:hypothetical protein